MSPVIELKETNVGPRITYRTGSEETGGKPSSLSSRLNPHGELNLDNPLILSTASELGITVQELIDKLTNLKIGEKLKWELTNQAR